MAARTLIANPDAADRATRACAIAAALAGIELRVVDPSDINAANPALYRQNCHPALPADARHGPVRVPALRVDHGYVFGCHAVLRCFARAGKGMYGSTDFEASQVDAWLDFVASEIEPALDNYASRRHTHDDTDTGEDDSALLAAFEGLNARLETRTFLVGERITVADVAVFVAFDGFLRDAPPQQASALVSTVGGDSQLQHLARHYMTVAHHKKVRLGMRRLGGEERLPACFTREASATFDV